MMRKKIYLIVLAVLVVLIVVASLLQTQHKQAQQDLVKNRSLELQQEIAAYIVTLAPKEAKSVTLFLSTDSKDDSQAYYIEAEQKNGESRQLDIDSSQILKLFDLAEKLDQAEKGDVLVSLYRPYDVVLTKRIIVDPASMAIDISHSEQRTVYPLPAYITEDEMYALDKEIQNSHDQYFNGIGIRFSHDDKQVLVVMYKIKDESTYLKFVNEAKEMQLHINASLCKLAPAIEQAGASIAYEYYYDSLITPVSYFTADLKQCHE